MQRFNCTYEKSYGYKIALFWLLNLSTPESLSSSTFAHESPVQLLAKHDELVFTLEPKDHISTDGVLEFTCQAKGTRKIQITWHNATDGQAVTDQVPSADFPSGIHINHYHGKLLVSNPIRGRVYSYYCNASNGGSWISSHPPVHGAIAYINSGFRNLPSRLVALEGQAAYIDCRPPKGFPEVLVFWTKGDTRLSSWQSSASNSLQRVLSLANGTLRITTVTYSDTGLYYCHASNIAGVRRSSVVAVSVRSTRYNLKTPRSIRTRAGEDVTIYCEVNESEVISWKKAENDDQIDYSKAHIASNYLFLENVQVSDSGTYICFIRGATVHAVNLTVDTPPVFVKEPSDLFVVSGDNAIFPCVAKGNPSPSIYWELPDMTPVFLVDAVRKTTTIKYLVHPEGHLEIFNVSMRDEGRYQCTAHSPVDTIHATAKLHIRHPTIKDRVAKNLYCGPGQKDQENSCLPVISLPPDKLITFVGERVTLPCQVGNHGSPDALSKGFQTYAPSWSIHWDRKTYSQKQPDVNWVSPEKPNWGRYGMLPSGTLHIDNLQVNDSGIYTCVVRSPFDWTTNKPTNVTRMQSTWSIKLEVTTDLLNETRYPILFPPRNFRDEAKTSHTVMLRWEPPIFESRYIRPTDFHDLAFWVEYYEPRVSTEGWIVVERNWPLYHIRVYGLKANTDYFFLIRSRWKNKRVGWASKTLGPIRTKALKQLTKNHDIASYAYNYQSLEPALEAVKLSDLIITTLSTSEIKVTWTTTGKRKTTIKAISQGIHIRELPFTDCNTLVSLDGGIAEHEKTYSHQQCRHAGEHDSGLQDKVTRFEKIRKLRGLNLRNPSNYISKVESCSKSFYSLTHCSSVFSGLHPFVCYELRVLFRLPEANENGHKMFRSEPKRFLTPQDKPTSTPTHIYYEWIGHSHVHLSWGTPNVKGWNGVLTGYVIYLTDGRSMKTRQWLDPLACLVKCRS
ncbi:unnamed protein product [Dicrocoelium dendriticum]|nr:unnamed protein product [Dicrocoelium dendriticum]